MGLLRYSFSFSVGTLLSRVFGYVRDAVIAYHFGASYVTDAFFVAFRLPNTFRRLLGEGGFNAAFIPVYAREIKEGRERDFLSSTFTYFTLISFVITLLGVVFSEVILSVLSPGLRHRPYFDLAVFMARWLFLYFLAVSLSSFFMAVLNTRGVFFVPAFAQAVFNIVSSFILAFATHLWGYYTLIVSTLVAGLAQVLFHLPSLLSQKVPLGVSFHLDKDVILLVKRLLPATAGFGVAQLSMFVDTFLASFLHQGSISYLYYANRIFQLPLGVVSVGVANSLLSVLSRGGHIKNNTTLAVSVILGLSLPSAVGLLLLAEPIVSLLYGRGRFSSQDVIVASHVLMAYSLGLVFFSVQKAISSVFFARGDTKTPVMASLLAVMSEGIFGYLYAFHLKLGVVGLALGNATSSLFAIGYLLAKDHTMIHWKTLAGVVIRCGVASAVMGYVAHTLAKNLPHPALVFVIPFCAFLYMVLVLLLFPEILRSLRKRFVEKLSNP
ncbi:integral membrane protein MviN [Thermocrinis albus DSM 14484]|uniref:Probable lipid II flippase MurJ n=1 Tax=Thermocrinis albus (strain DSM 14484 / JCM 11386 / HI 11/12) TaxID=638303 RepID=D3SPT1_THEAH|nr:murein biosynthesis integral membrane protein MurJ [Thermocrinis albus]ADC89168.1 integral membrane protein MviN [Thermocrinis albus DSM 14484]